MPETWPPASSRTAFSTFMGILIERAKSFEVPNGIMPRTAGVAMTAFATAPTVPSPPAATTIGGGEPLPRNRSGRRASSSTAISAATSSPLLDIARRARASFSLWPACGLTTRISRLVAERSVSAAEDGGSHHWRAACISGPPLTAPTQDRDQAGDGDPEQGSICGVAQSLETDVDQAPLLSGQAFKQPPVESVNGG